MTDQQRKRKWDDPIGEKSNNKDAIKNAIEVAKKLKEKLQQNEDKVLDKDTVKVKSNLKFSREFKYDDGDSESLFKSADFISTLKSKLQLGPSEDFDIEFGHLKLILKATSEDVLDLAEKECQTVKEIGHFRFSAQVKPAKLTEKIFLTFTPLPAHISFVRGKLLGPQGSYLKHIQTTTNTRVQLRGKGSGNFEIKGPVVEGSEPESMHLTVEGSDRDSVNEAKQLCEDLISTVKSEYDAKIANVTPSPILHCANPYQYQAYLQAVAYAQYYAQYYAKDDLDKNNKP